jgi:hypothetical protein
MDDAESELLLHRILNGHLIFYYKQDKYELRSVTNNIRYEADLLFQKIIADEKYSEWIREEKVDSFLINLGLWNSDTPKLIILLEKKIENLKVELFENFMNTSGQKRIRNNLTQARNQLERIKTAKTEFSAHTLEGYASSIKHEYIVCYSLYKNNKKVFDFESKDHNSMSLSYFNDLIAEINKYIISIENFKKLARSYLWKSYWNINKNNTIFPGAISEWTDDQRSLVSFSQMYDSIHEHPECPDDKIIEDDDMLDGWMISQKRKIMQEKKQTTIDSLNPNLKKASEVFLFGQKPEEIEEILSLNDKIAMNRMKEKIQYINAHGSAEDGALPDNRRQITADATQMLNNRK